MQVPNVLVYTEDEDQAYLYSELVSDDLSVNPTYRLIACSHIFDLGWFIADRQPILVLIDLANVNIETIEELNTKLHHFTTIRQPNCQIIYMSQDPAQLASLGFEHRSLLLPTNLQTFIYNEIQKQKSK